tara:strand:+ start:8119 stop:9861 length:1743 start_codon:yes stop_codon:yes gene_type:complete
MSGQPNINPSDAMKFRQQYLSSLDLRVRLDDVNLQANKVYKRTGQLPVEPSDFRTIEEKLADTERLKIEVRSKLSEITDGKEANKIAQELTPKQAVFYLQMSEAINKEIKPKYRLGIYAEIFLPFLQEYMNTQANINGIKTGLQQTSGKGVELNRIDILKSFYTGGELQEWGKRYSPALSNMGIDKRLVGRLTQQINNIGRLTDGLLGAITDLSDTYTIDADKQNEAYKLINDIIQEFPTKVQLNRWGDKSFMYARANDKQGLTRHIEEGISLFELQPERVIMTEELGKILSGLPTKPPANLVPGKAGSAKSLDRGDEPDPQTFADFSKTDLIKWARSAGIRISAKLEKGNKATLMDYLTRVWSPEMMKDEEEGDFIPGGTSAESGRTDGDMSSLSAGKGMRGRGVNRIMKPKQVKPAVDWYGGINPTPKFVPFGKYIINKHRLENNVIAVKRPAGSSIKEFPSERVSRRLGGIIRGLTNNEMPDFDDLNDLDDSEKVYLNKLAEKTNLKDRLILPAPKKSDIDKEVDDFEIMKGEIMSGNDNKDLVRKFKSTLLKLSNKGVIPKSQVKELLLELTEMGF